MSTTLLDSLRTEYSSTLQETSRVVRDLVRRARAGGVTLHIVCRNRKEHDNAKSQLEGVRNVRITSTIEETPATEFRVRWSDFASQTPHSEG